VKFHLGLTDSEKRLFEEMGLDHKNSKLLLSTVLSSPEAFVNNLGNVRTVHLTAWLCSQFAQEPKVQVGVLPSEDLGEFLNGFARQTLHTTGALPDD
jgi:hypothetical protein